MAKGKSAARGEFGGVGREKAELAQNARRPIRQGRCQMLGARRAAWADSVAIGMPLKRPSVTGRTRVNAPLQHFEAAKFRTL